MLNCNSRGFNNLMRKIFNFMVLLILIKKNNIKEKYSFNLWNWQEKVLYKIAKNKYLKSL